MGHLTEYELGWLIGILEGEGSFGYYTASQYIDLASTDEDTVCRAAILFEKITGQTFNIAIREDPRNHMVRKTAYRLRAGGENARTIMKLIVKHMSARRRSQIWRSLNRYQPPKKKLDIKAIANIVQMRRNGT